MTVTRTWLIAHGALGRDRVLHNVAMAQVRASSADKALTKFYRQYSQRIPLRRPVELGKGE